MATFPFGQYVHQGQNASEYVDLLTFLGSNNEKIKIDRFGIQAAPNTSFYINGVLTNNNQSVLGTPLYVGRSGIFEASIPLTDNNSTLIINKKDKFIIDYHIVVGVSE